ncbi:MAG: DUF1508 domain-containing protein [Bacteroidota bacterium]|jgi:uncharacterized protein YegP (UPF0339 family)
MTQLPDRWQFYKDKPGQWQWRKFEANKVVAVSYDGFYSRRECVNNAKTRGYILVETKELLCEPDA